MSSEKAWSGRFEGGNARALEDFHSSLRFDRRLWKEDIAGSVAHAAMLAKVGVVGAKDAEEIQRGLALVFGEIEGGTFAFEAADEDIHMAVEKRLTVLIGAAGGRLHTGRSRNDQVITDVRLHLRGHIDDQMKGMKGFIAVLVAEAEKHGHLILPGTTHLQPAQPMLLGFWFLAWAHMFRRDVERLADARKRVNESPLGSGAFAGVSYPIDRSMTAAALGFDRPMANAMDGVSDRDFLVEYISAAALFLTHTSRLCEELILWSNPRFGFLTMDDRWSTGSSIMPNKKNPDACELVRGKTGRVVGHLVSLLTVMKGLPLAYNKDLQEDKEAMFDTLDTVEAVLSVMPGVVSTLAWHGDAMREACDEGYLQATDVADYLVGKGLPFREAHHVSGALVGRLVKEKKTYRDLTAADWKGIHPLFGEDILKTIDLDRVIRNKQSMGSTHPDEVAKQVVAMKQWLAK